MQMSFEHDFFERSETLPFFSRGLLIDTGPLFLFLLGKYAPNKLVDFGYTVQDFSYLIDFLSSIHSNKLVITPHVFHEFYKHTQKIFANGHSAMLKQMSSELKEIHEENIAKDDILHSAYLEMFEIGELSLYLAYHDLPTAILIDEQRGVFSGKLRDDDHRLVMNFRSDIVPFMQNLL